MAKVFNSFEEFEKEFFPKSYEKKQLQELIKQKGFGTILAEMFIKSIKEELEKLEKV